MKINKDMTISEVISLNPEIAGVFTGLGMHCVGCAIAHGETVAEAAAVHGIDLDVMLEKLNAFLADNQ